MGGTAYQNQETTSGKAKPYRTGGGKAADSQHSRSAMLLISLIRHQPNHRKLTVCFTKLLRHRDLAGRRVVATVIDWLVIFVDQLEAHRMFAVYPT